MTPKFGHEDIGCYFASARFFEYRLPSNLAMGWPCAIHSEITLPAPPDDWMPMELNPAATKNPLTNEGLSQIIPIVGCEAFRPAEKRMYTSFAQNRHPMQRIVQRILKVIPVFGQLIETEILWNAVHSPRFRLRTQMHRQEVYPHLPCNRCNLSGRA